MSKVSPSIAPASPADHAVGVSGGHGAAGSAAAPLSLQDIRALAQVISDFGLSELTLTRAGGDHLCLRREVTAAPSPTAFGAPLLASAPTGGVFGAAPARPPEPPAPAREKTSLVAVTSPFVGTFYRAANPDAPPFVEVGQRVRKGQTLCIIEAMKLMNELESDVEGVVAECQVQNGRPVEYGQVLFQIDVG